MWACRSELLEQEFRFGCYIFGNGVHPCCIPGQSFAHWTSKYNSRWTDPSCSSSSLTQYLPLSYKHKSVSAKCRTACCQRQFEINGAKCNFFMFNSVSTNNKSFLLLCQWRIQNWEAHILKQWLRSIDIIYEYLPWRNNPVGQGLFIFQDSVKITTLSRTPLDEWSACRSALFLTPLTSDKRQCPGGIGTHNLSRWAAADSCLTVRL